MIYKPRAAITIHVPKFGSKTEALDVQPRIITAKWTKNNHLLADELTVGVGWKEGGVEPRLMKNATCGFFLWDAMVDGEDPSDLTPFTRFTGVGHKATRKLTDNGWVVEVDFLDYTSFFLNMKPFPTGGLPQWTDTLTTAWQKICDHVGPKDLTKPSGIDSSVKILRDRLVFRAPEVASAQLADIIPARFHAIAKPSIPANTDAWAVWQYLVGSLGLISYIDKDQCIVTNTTEHYQTAKAPSFIQGQNILEFEEAADAGISNKGVLLKSFDPLLGRVIEAAFPPPGDDRLKQRRSVAVRAEKEGRTPTVNELSADYEEFESYDVTDQAALNKKAEKAYEERKRQEMQGKIKTREMRIKGSDGSGFDTLSLSAGDPIAVTIDPKSQDILQNVELSDDDRVRYLVDRCGYTQDLAQVLVNAAKQYQLKAPIFHIKTLAVDLGPENFDIDIEYHNLVVLD